MFVQFVIANPSLIMWGITAAYIAQAAVYFITKNYNQSLMVGAYALANIGLIRSIP